MASVTPPARKFLFNSWATLWLKSFRVVMDVFGGVRRKCGKYCAVKLRNVLMFSFIGVSFVRHLSFVEVN